MKPLKPFKETINGIRCGFVNHGGFYRLEFTDPRSHVRQRKSTGTANPTAAKAFAYALLQDWVPGVSTVTKITVADLVKASLQTEATNQQLYNDTLGRWELRLCDKFGSWDHRDLKSAVLEDYKLWAQGVPIDDNSTPLRRSWAPITEVTVTRTRVKNGVEKSWDVRLGVLEEASIHKDLMVLSKAYTLGRTREEITYEPVVPTFGADDFNVRTGMLELDEFDRIMALDDVPLGIRALLQTYRDSGTRTTELKNAKVSQLVIVHTEEGEAGLIKLAPGRARNNANGQSTTKNRKGRVVPLSVAAYALVAELVKGKGPDNYIFTRDDRRGPSRKINSFRDMWKTMLKRAGIDRHVLIHDLRRTSVTEFEEAGVSREVSKSTSGHETDHVYGRYNVTNTKRLIDGIRKKEQWQAEQRRLREGKQETSGGAEQVAALQAELAAAKAALEAVQQAFVNMNLAQTVGNVSVLGQQRKAEVN